jgi:hypothetical protein
VGVGVGVGVGMGVGVSAVQEPPGGVPKKMSERDPPLGRVCGAVAVWWWCGRWTCVKPSPRPRHPCPPPERDPPPPLRPHLPERDPPPGPLPLPHEVCRCPSQCLRDTLRVTSGVSFCTFVLVKASKLPLPRQLCRCP